MRGILYNFDLITGLLTLQLLHKNPRKETEERKRKTFTSHWSDDSNHDSARGVLDVNEGG